MKKYILMICFALSHINAEASPCINRREIRTYLQTDAYHINVYIENMWLVLSTTNCAKPLTGDSRLSFQSSSDNINVICEGDKAVISLNGLKYSECKILSIKAR